MAVAVLLAPGPASALTLQELLAEKELTPKKFASRFADFEYEFAADVLPADVFLQRRKGDCDDYAVSRRARCSALLASAAAILPGNSARCAPPGRLTK